MDDERLEWTVCGRIIGTATGWDKADTFAITIYEFEPYETCTAPSGDILIDFEIGTIDSYDDNGDLLKRVDLIDAIANCRKP